MIKRFKFSKTYGRAYTRLAQESWSDARTIALERKEASLPEHILISIITKQSDNWKRLQEIAGESLRIEIPQIEQWIREYLNTSTDEEVQRRTNLFYEIMIDSAVGINKRQFSMHTGHLLIGLLRLQNGFLTSHLTNMKIEVEPVIAEFKTHMESEDLTEPVGDSLLAFLATQNIDITLKDASDGDEIHLTIPAISLFQTLVNAFTYSQAGRDTDRDYITQTRPNGQSMSIRISPENDTNTP